MSVKPRSRALSVWATCFVVAAACGKEDALLPEPGDGDGDDPTNMWVAIDTDGDGIVDGIDTDGDGIADIVGTPIDWDGDGIIDSLDTNGDGIPDVALPGFMLPGSDTGGVGNLGTGGGNRASGCDGPSVRGGQIPAIDDLEHPEQSTIPELDRRRGSWFTAEEFLSGAAQTPEVGHIFPTAAVGRDGSYGFWSTLSGFSGRSIEDSGIGWGPQFGFTLNERGGLVCSYDASAFDGVTFCARSGDGATYELQFGVSMLVVIPTTRGGTCAGEGCGDVHFRTVEIGPDWKCDYDVRWEDLSQNRNLEHNNKYPFDPADIAQISWTSWAGDYDVIVDDVRFLGGATAGTGGAGGSGEPMGPGGLGGAF